MSAQGALIDVGAREAIARVSRCARTREGARGVRADRVDVAIVLGERAFVFDVASVAVAVAVGVQLVAIRRVRTIVDVTADSVRVGVVARAGSGAQRDLITDDRSVHGGARLHGDDVRKHASVKLAIHPNQEFAFAGSVRRQLDISGSDAGALCWSRVVELPLGSARGYADVTRRRTFESREVLLHDLLEVILATFERDHRRSRFRPREQSKNVVASGGE